MTKRTYPEVEGDPWTPKLRQYINNLEEHKAELLDENALLRARITELLKMLRIADSVLGEERCHYGISLRLSKLETRINIAITAAERDDANHPG